MASEAERLIALLGLQPHPEGGWFRETFRDAEMIDGRARSTAIHFLLAAGQSSWWHRVDAVEIWHWHAGAPLRLCLSHEGKNIDEYILGSALRDAERPQVVVPRHCWQTARSLGAWTLVGCTVAPGFQFSGFELAESDWTPGE